MFSIDSLLSSPLIEHLGWMLVHACWQGLLIGAALAGTLRLLRNHTPSVRYAVSCMALVLLVALPVGTSLLLHAPSAAPASIASERGSQPVRSSEPGMAQGLAALRASSAETASSLPWTHPATWDDAAARLLRPWLPWMVAAWAFGLLFAAGRLVGGALHVRRLRRRSRAAPEPWSDRLSELAHRLDLPSVPLRVAQRIDGPMVVGWFRPMVLVPAGMLTGLPPNQIEALLVHELAHVRRHDVLVGWIQAVVEAVLFFHPATWWISSRIRRERELCCDDWAIETGADTLAYAEALTAIAEQQVRPTLALAASEGPLLQRIRRLLATQPAASEGWRQRVSLAAAVSLLAAGPLLVAACASQQETATTRTTTDSPGQAAAADSVAPSAVAVRGDEKASLRIEADSGETTAYRMYLSRDSAKSTVEIRPETLKNGVVWLHHDSLRTSFPFSADDSTRRLRFFADDDAGAFMLHLDGDSLAAGVFVDSLLANLRIPESPFPVDSLLVKPPSGPNDALPDRFFAPPVPDLPHRLFGDTIRVPLEKYRDRFRKWREEGENEWTPERLEELERRLRRWHEQHADSLEQRAEEWAEQFAGWQEKFTDEWEFDSRRDGDRWMRRYERQADSARARAERLRQRLESEEWQRELRRLREQAERLRDHAERLEERAREMEERLPPDSLR